MLVLCVSANRGNVTHRAISLITKATTSQSKCCNRNRKNGKKASRPRNTIHMKVSRFELYGILTLGSTSRKVAPPYTGEEIDTTRWQIKYGEFLIQPVCYIISVSMLGIRGVVCDFESYSNEDVPIPCVPCCIDVILRQIARRRCPGFRVLVRHVHFEKGKSDNVKSLPKYECSSIDLSRECVAGVCAHGLFHPSVGWRKCLLLRYQGLLLL